MHRPVNHLPHLLLFLQAVEKTRKATSAEAAVSIPPEAFVLREDDLHFWELLAFSIRGFPSLLVGGVRFRRQEAGKYSRQSLVSFLSASTREVNLHETPVPPHLVEIMVSNRRQSVHEFLKGCRQGTDYPLLKVAKKDVRFAFDFRLANPSRSHRRQGAAKVSWCRVACMGEIACGGEADDEASLPCRRTPCCLLLPLHASCCCLPPAAATLSKRARRRASACSSIAPPARRSRRRFIPTRSLCSIRRRAATPTRSTSPP